MADADQELFLQFHQLATARKMDLAMRGLPVPNVMVDEMFDAAQQQGITSDGWNAFVRSQFPSPRSEESSAEASAAHPLRDISKLLREAIHGDDVDVPSLIELIRQFIVIIENLGAFASISVTEAKSNLHKIETGLKAAAGRGSSLLGLLKSEKQSGMHGAGGILADPSAAMGVLWIGRFLKFWQEVCILQAQPPPPDGGAIVLRSTIERVYEHTLLPYHGCAAPPLPDLRRIALLHDRCLLHACVPACALSDAQVDDAESL